MSKEIQEALLIFGDTYDTVAQKCGVSRWKVEQVAKTLPEEIRKARYKVLASNAKRGDKNPCFGKCGLKHHNAKSLVRVNGYKTVFKPSWWTGTTIKSGRVYEHHYEWCLANGKTELPNGHVIHHKDGNKDNNNPSNLECMTHSDHMKLHWSYMAIPAGATTISKESTIQEDWKPQES